MTSVSDWIYWTNFSGNFPNCPESLLAEIFISGGTRLTLKIWPLLQGVFYLKFLSLTVNPTHHLLELLIESDGS